MPILDIRAGSTALANANNAAQSLIAAYMARSKGLSEGISGIGKAFSDYAKTKDEMATNESKRAHLDANTAEQKAQSEALNQKGEDGKSARQKQIENEIKTKEWQNEQLRQFLSKKDEKSPSAYEKQLNANLNNTKSQTSANYAGANLRSQQAKGQNIENSMNHTDNMYLMKDSPQEQFIYGATFNNGNPNYDFEHFKKTGTLRPLRVGVSSLVDF